MATLLPSSRVSESWTSSSPHFAQVMLSQDLLNSIGQIGHLSGLHKALGREQFGKPLAEFQSIQTKLGAGAIELDAGRLLVFRAAFEKDDGAERITLEAAMAKAFATEAAQRIIDDAVQIVGGIGVLSDHPVELLYRSVRALRIYEGTTEIQQMIVAGGMIREARESRTAGGAP